MNEHATEDGILGASGDAPGDSEPPEGEPSGKSSPGNKSSPGKEEGPQGRSMPDEQASSGIGAWVEDEGLLRDEGTVFGLTGLEEGLGHKVEAIREHYEAKKAGVERKRERVGREIEAAERRRSEIEEKIGRLQSRIEEPLPPIDGASDAHRHLLFRYAAGVLFAGGICGFNFFLIHALLQPHFERSLLVTAGVVCAGLFSLFQPTSLFFAADGEPGGARTATGGWKTGLAEIGMPVAASLFVAGWVYPELGLARTGSVFAYLTMIFLLGGKLLLSTIPRLALTVRVLARDVRAGWIRFWARRKRDRLREEVLPRLEEEKKAAKQRRDEIPAPAEIDARRKAAAQLFRSEYALARQAVGSGLITPTERQTLTNPTESDETVA